MKINKETMKASYYYLDRNIRIFLWKKHKGSRNWCLFGVGPMGSESQLVMSGLSFIMIVLMIAPLDGWSIEAEDGARAFPWKEV